MPVRGAVWIGARLILTMEGGGAIDVAAAVVRRGGRYLACRRRPEDSSGGRWEFPGGKRETGESLEDCLVREIREELGCRVEPGRRIAEVKTAWRGRTIRVHFFEAALVEGEPEPIECAEIAWIAPADLPSFDWLGANREFVARLAAGEAR